MLTRTSAERVQCSICLAVCSDKLGRIQCSHTFCLQCILQWTKVNNTCPVCRRPITMIHKLIVGNIKSLTKKLKEIEPQAFIVHPAINDDSLSELSYDSSSNFQHILYFGVDPEYLRSITERIALLHNHYLGSSSENQQFTILTQIIHPWLRYDF